MSNKVPLTFTDDDLKRVRKLASDMETFAVGGAQLHALLGHYEAMQDALVSIANNSCCDKCQEASLVAKAALSPYR